MSENYNLWELYVNKFLTGDYKDPEQEEVDESEEQEIDWFGDDDDS